MEYRVIDKQGHSSGWTVEADAHEYVRNRISRGYAVEGDEWVESRDVPDWKFVDPPEPTERDKIVQWFIGAPAYGNRRESLAALLPEDADKVTITYAQLLDMVETVRRNSRQR